jgi:hypothetical protein
LKIYAQTLTSARCFLCRGYGHLSKKCATKRIVDHGVKDNKLWKIIWGTVKGKTKSDRVKKRIEKFKTKLLSKTKDPADFKNDDSDDDSDDDNDFEDNQMFNANEDETNVEKKPKTPTKPKPGRADHSELLAPK